MKDYEFLEPAQIELEEEVKYFNRQQVGLGYEFANEVANAIDRILRHPEAWSNLSQKSSSLQNQKISARCYLPNPRRQDPDRRDHAS
jgi:hypothetical protein